MKGEKEFLRDVGCREVVAGEVLEWTHAAPERPTRVKMPALQSTTTGMSGEQYFREVTMKNIKTLTFMSVAIPADVHRIGA